MILTLCIICTLQPSNVYAYTDYTSDEARILTEEDKTSLNELLNNIESQTTIEMFIVTTNNLNGYSIEEIAEETFDELQVGKKGKDNGLLLFISMEEREFRLEVGYGLEGVITDIQSDRVLESMTEDFQSEDYYTGIVKAIGGAVECLNESGEYTLDVDLGISENESSLTPGQKLILAVIIAIAVILDLIFNDGRLTFIALRIIASSSSSKGSSRGSGGRSGGGGASRRW